LGTEGRKQVWIFTVYGERRSLAPGSNGIIQRIAVAWGAGDSAWSFTTDYRGLGSAPPIVAPAAAYARGDGLPLPPQ
jgi:hypothetical protein